MKIINKIMERMSIIGSDKNINMITFLSEYSSRGFLENNDNKNKNIKKANSGRRMKIPIITIIGKDEKAKKERPLKSHKTRVEYLQFSFLKSASKSSNAINS